MNLDENRLKTIEEKLDRLTFLLEKHLQNQTDNVVEKENILESALPPRQVEELKPTFMEVKEETKPEEAIKPLSNPNGSNNFYAQKYGYAGGVVKDNLNTSSSTNSSDDTSMSVKEGKPKDTVSFFKKYESVIGKYLIGAFAALLLFIASVSFVMMIYNRIPDIVKQAVLIIIGLSLTAFGFYRVNKDKDSTIPSVLIGTGAGVIYISIVAATMVFHFIRLPAAIILCAIWSIFFILSTRYTNLFFTGLISYLGSYITLVYGLSIFMNVQEFIYLLCFIVIILAVMIYSSYLRNKKELLISVCLAVVGLFTVLGYCWYYSDIVSIILNTYIYQLIIFILTYLLANYVYKLADKKYVYIATAFIATLSCFFTLDYIKEYIILTDFYFHIILIVVHLIQFLVNIFFYPDNELGLNTYYIIALLALTINFNIDIYNVLAGGAVVGLLLIFRNKLLNKTDFLNIILFAAILESFLLLLSIHQSLLVGLYALITLGNVFYYSVHEKNNKMLVILLTLLNIFSFSANIFRLPMLQPYSDYGSVLFHIFSMAILYIFYQNDFFENIKLSIKFHPLIIALNILFIYGLFVLVYHPNLIITLLLTLTTLTTLLSASYLIRDNMDNSPTSLFEIIKYLLFTWVVLNSVFDLPFDSFVYSVSGLIIALGTIYLGFKFNNKFFRQYGLILTIIMVIKFVLIDIRIENSITRVLSYVIGSIVCFIISYTYNKLSKSFDNQ